MANFFIGNKLKRVEKTVSTKLLKEWSQQVKGEDLKRVLQELRRRKKKS